MSDHAMIYALAGALLILGIGLGMWLIRRRPEVRHDPHSGLTEVEEARRKMLH